MFQDNVKPFSNSDLDRFESPEVTKIFISCLHERFQETVAKIIYQYWFSSFVLSQHFKNGASISVPDTFEAAN